MLGIGFLVAGISVLILGRDRPFTVIGGTVLNLAGLLITVLDIYFMVY
jgi:hypothetical protein